MNLLFFILGILFSDFVQPLLEEIGNLILTVIETKKGKYAVEIAKLNKEVLEIKEENEEKEPLRVMGFQFDANEEEIEEEDDD